LEHGDDRRRQGGREAGAGVEKAFKRIEEIFAKYKA
jgi:hypothetical protein